MLTETDTVIKTRIRLLTHWQNEVPDLAVVDWREVRTGITAALCRRFSATPNQIFSRCSKTPTDFAEEIIEEYLLGEILWNREHSPTTASMIALLSLAAERDVLDQSCRRRNGRRIARSEQSIDELHTQPLTEPTASCEEIQCAANGYLTLLYNELDRRPDPHPRFREYVELQLDELKPAAIAEEMQIPIEEVHKMRKRLKRRLAPLVPPELLAGRSRGDRNSPGKQRVQHV